MKRKIENVIKLIGKCWSILVFVCVFILVGCRFIPVLFGYEPIWCMSNSMAPAFHEGALCYIDTNYDVESIEVGDVIAYKLSNGAFVTHRVHELTENGIITKGDANANVDFAPIDKSQVVGENVLQIEYLGNLFKDFPNMLLISLVVFAASVMLALDIISNILLEEEEKKEMADKAKEEMV
jgi:signal peptidase